MKTEQLFAYRITWTEFFKFEAYGRNALNLFFIVEVMANMQKNTGLYLPVKGQPSWVRVSNTLWKKDPASKSRTIKKLEKAKLISVQRVKNKTELSNPVVKINRLRKKKIDRKALSGSRAAGNVINISSKKNNGPRKFNIWKTDVKK